MLKSCERVDTIPGRAGSASQNFVLGHSCLFHVKRGNIWQF